MEKWEEEIYREADRKMAIDEKRIRLLTEYATKNKKGFLAHVARVLSRFGRKDYNAYVKEIRLIVEAIPEDELWRRHRKKLTYTTNGFLYYLSMRMEHLVYPSIAKAAGIDPATIETLMRKRAEEVYQSRKTLAEAYTYKPPENYNAPNDLTAKRFQTATEWEWNYGEITVIEQRANKKKKRPYIESKIKLGLKELKELGFGSITRLEVYAIFTAISSQLSGNKADSIDTIYRAMGGKGKSPNDIRESILQGIVKGMSTPVTIDATGICNWQGYKGKDAYVIDTILPARIQKVGYLKGAEVEDLIVYKGESPFVIVARAKGNQFITYDAALLDVPFKKNVNNILIPPYLLQHIEDTFHAPKLEKSIVIDKAIEALEYRGKRTRFVDYVLTCVKHWTGAGYLGGYDIEKDGHGKIVKVRYKKPTRKIAKG